MKQNSETKELLDLSRVHFSDIIRKSDDIQNLCEDFMVKNVTSDNFRFNEEAGISYVSESGVRRPQISRFALGQLCAKIGVPANYIDSCVASGRIDLAQDNINSWLDDYKKSLFIREYNGEIRGVLTERYSVCDTPYILKGIEDVLPVDDYIIEGHYLDPSFTHVRMVSKKMLPIDNEDLYAGISVDTSDVGRSNLQVNFFIYKKVCTNGLVVPKRLGQLFKQKHIGISSEDFRMGLKESLILIPKIQENVIEAINNTVDSSLERMFKSSENLETLINDIRQRTKLSEDSANKVIDLMQTTYAKNRWGLINSITQVAQDFTLARRLELERIAGDMLVA